jgi:hypothetical protein
VDPTAVNSGLSRRALVVSVPALAAVGCANHLAAPQPVQTANSSLDHLRKNIRKYVEDKPERERALAKVDALRDTILEFDRLALEWRERSHEAGPDDEALLYAIADDINARMREQLLRAGKLVYSLREDIPASTWTKVFTTPDAHKRSRS